MLVRLPCRWYVASAARESAGDDGSGDVVSVRIDLERLGCTDLEFERLLLEGDPSIVTWCRNGSFRVKLGTLQPGEVDLVVRRLQELLAA